MNTAPLFLARIGPLNLSESKQIYTRAAKPKGNMTYSTETAAALKRFIHDTGK
jgi:hypothetical protein